MRIIWMPVTSSGERSSFLMLFGPRSSVRRALARTTASSCLDVGMSNSQPTGISSAVQIWRSERSDGVVKPAFDLTEKSDGYIGAFRHVLQREPFDGSPEPQLPSETFVAVRFRGRFYFRMI